MIVSFDAQRQTVNGNVECRESSRANSFQKQVVQGGLQGVFKPAQELNLVAYRGLES
jgi:hypothetical protein